ncbi:MAG TPA: hypothetical protein VGR00_02190, partial [Thermoanaerobaculia bacterium]|nr:hypothetical protein [Thermoanaerobaculia bacterium]
MTETARWTLRLLWVAAVGLLVSALSATADDKDLLKRGSVNGNLLVIFGNSQTTIQPLNGTTSQWDGDGDSPTSKMGAAKRVIQQFVNEKQGTFNIGLSSFSHNPNAGSITLTRKHWLYSPAAVDFPNESWQEPVGTVERWGDRGEGPCTSLTVPACTGASPAIALQGGASVVGPFFGSRGLGTAYVNLGGAERVVVTVVEGQYGDAYVDGTLAQYKRGTYALSVQKVYQKKVGSVFVTQAVTPNGSPGTVVVPYVPAPNLTPDLFFRSEPDAGKAIGFLSDSQSDL